MRFLIILSVLLVTGCTSDGPSKIEYVYQDVLTPVSNVPMPPDTSCPDDAVKIANPKSPDSDIARSFRIAVLQLRDCITLKDKVIDKYRDIAKEDKGKLENFDVEDGMSMTSGKATPFGSAVTADMANQPPRLDPIVNTMTETEILRQTGIDKEFKGLADEFGDLSKKEYDLE